MVYAVCKPFVNRNYKVNRQTREWARVLANRFLTSVCRGNRQPMTMSLVDAFEKSASAAAATVERVARDSDQIAAAVARVAPAGPLAVAGNWVYNPAAWELKMEIPVSLPPPGRCGPRAF